MVNAAFAMATAIGAASGPGGAILLDMVPEFQFTIPLIGVQTFNGMTGPGVSFQLFLNASQILLDRKGPLICLLISSNESFLALRNESHFISIRPLQQQQQQFL